MQKMKLTKTSVNELPFANKGKQVDYFDTELDGFGVRVSATTKKYFVRRLIGKKRVRVMIGTASVKSAEKARSEAKIKLGVMESGIDPNAVEREKHQAELERDLALNVQSLIDKYIEEHAKIKKKSWREDKRCLEKEVLPLWGKRKIHDIRKRDVVLLLDEIVKRGSPIMANNTFEKVRKMFNFAVDKDLLETTPCFSVKKPTETISKDRVLNHDEIISLWHDLEYTAMSEEIRRALKLILVTGQRPGEVIGLHSREINGKWWILPPERCKNKRMHRVFLTPTAIDIIGDKQGFIFESPRGEKSIHTNAVACAVRRNLEEPSDGEKKEEIISTDANDSKPFKMIMKNWTPHDLRRTMATELSVLGYTDEIIDAVLNHVKKGVIATYNRNRYDNEKEAALQAWEQKLVTIIGSL